MPKPDPFAHHKEKLAVISDLLREINGRVGDPLCVGNQYGDGSVILWPWEEGGEAPALELDEEGRPRPWRMLRWAWEDLPRLEQALKGYLAILPTLASRQSQVVVFWDAIRTDAPPPL